MPDTDPKKPDDPARPSLGEKTATVQPKEKLDVQPPKAPDKTIPGGLYVDEAGHWVNADGEHVDKDGKKVDKPVCADGKPTTDDEAG